jgi:hypothetical protein
LPEFFFVNHAAPTAKSRILVFFPLYRVNCRQLMRCEPITPRLHFLNPFRRVVTSTGHENGGAYNAIREFSKVI